MDSQAMIQQEAESCDMVMETQVEDMPNRAIERNPQNDLTKDDVPKGVPAFTYRDRVVGFDRNDVLQRPIDDGFMSEDDELCEEEEEEECPTIVVTKEEKYILRAPWRQSLIIKVMGSTVGYNYLFRRIKML